LSIIGDEATRRRGERLVRIIEFCDSSRTRNDVVAFAKREKVGVKKTIEDDLRYLLSKGWLSCTKHSKPGLADYYTATESGKLEARNWRRTQKGELRGLIPGGPLKITYEFPKEGPGSLIGDVLRDLQLKVLNDPKRREEIFTLIGSMLMVHAQRAKDEITTFEGKFLSDGRYQMAMMFSRDESIRLRKMAESGKFETGKEEKHLAELIGLFGIGLLSDLYRAHEHSGFIPDNTVISFVPFSTDNSGKFQHRPAQVPNLEERIRKTFELHDSVK
jgi:DNA-binding PadR family transcriptional regulator